MTISALSVVGVLAYLALSPPEGNPAQTANNQPSVRRPAALSAPVSQQQPRIAGNFAAKPEKIIPKTAYIAVSNENSKPKPVEMVQPLPVELKGSYLQLTKDELQRLGVEVKDSSLITQNNDGEYVENVEISSETTHLWREKSIGIAAVVSPIFITSLDGRVRLHTSNSPASDALLSEETEGKIPNFTDKPKSDEKKLLMIYPPPTNPNSKDEERVMVRETDKTILQRDVVYSLSLGLTTPHVQHYWSEQNKALREDFVLNNYVGVKVVLGQDAASEQGFILWYKPTEEFLTKLPDLTREQIEQELGIKPQSAVTGCHFTQQCLTSNGAILETSVTRYKDARVRGIKVNFTLAEDRVLSFALYTLDGHKTDLQKNISLARGQRQYEMDFGNSPSGLYLMVITSDKGERVVQRIILED